MGVGANDEDDVDLVRTTGVGGIEKRWDMRRVGVDRSRLHRRISDPLPHADLDGSRTRADPVAGVPPGIARTYDCRARDPLVCARSGRGSGSRRGRRSPSWCSGAGARRCVCRNPLRNRNSNLCRDRADHGGSTWGVPPDTRTVCHAHIVGIKNVSGQAVSTWRGHSFVPGRPLNSQRIAQRQSLQTRTHTVGSLATCCRYAGGRDGRCD